MKRIANCCVIVDEKIVMLQKPSRGWFVVPGGKLEPGESYLTAAYREFKEETGAEAVDLELNGHYTIVIREAMDQPIIEEWELVTYRGKALTGELLKESKEGAISWQSVADLKTLPMAEGDRLNLEFAVAFDGVLQGTVHYTPTYELLHTELIATNQSGREDK